MTSEHGILTRFICLSCYCSFSFANCRHDPWLHAYQINMRMISVLLLKIFIKYSILCHNQNEKNLKTKTSSRRKDDMQNCANWIFFFFQCKACRFRDVKIFHGDCPSRRFFPYRDEDGSKSCSKANSRMRVRITLPIPQRPHTWKSTKISFI